MNNLEIANDPTGAKFMESYAKAKAKAEEAESKKKPINTAPFTICEQVERFEKTFFSDEDEQALYEDALSV